MVRVTDILVIFPPDLSSTLNEYPVVLDLSSNEFTGSLPHVPPNPNFIDLSRNKFSGTIQNVCTVTSLSSIDLSNNQLFGEIPQDCFNLDYLNLANNNLSGKIPTSYNLSCEVSSLHLRNNSISGEIPRSLMNCSRLRFLDLGENEFNGKTPSWLGANMPYLTVLILKSNKFYGSLPSSICHLSNLQVLDISSNNIIGNIPSCMDNFTMLSSNMNSDSWRNQFPTNRMDDYVRDRASVIWKGKEETYMNTLKLLKMIDLSSNELSGVIPHEITNLVGLLGLNLSHNNLVGLVPHKLSGSIPTTLSKLRVLDLSFNNLSGRIPWDNHLQTFGASSYLGNPGLCGSPLVSRPCPEDDDDDDEKVSDPEDESSLINRGFYISLLLGFVLAFWVVFWTLFFNKWWTAAVWKIYNTAGDWLYVKILVTKRRFFTYFGIAS